MARKKTSISFDEKLWDDVKIHCIKTKKDISEYLEELVRKDIKKKK